MGSPRKKGLEERTAFSSLDARDPVLFSSNVSKTAPRIDRDSAFHVGGGFADVLDLDDMAGADASH